MRFQGIRLGRSLIGPLLLAVTVVAALVYGFWPRPVPVELAAAVRGPFTLTVTEEGRTQVRDRYVVSAPVAGFARRIAWEVGDAVTQGEVLAGLDPLPSQVLDPRSQARAEAQVAAAQATLGAARQRESAAQADAQLARRALERARALVEAGDIARERLDQAEAAWQRAEADLRSARLGVEVARFELEAARTALRYTAARPEADPEPLIQLEAPVSGRVLRVHHRSEGVVSAGEALIEVGDPRALEVAVDVLSSDAVRIEPGTRVTLDRWGGDEALDGVVRHVEPSAFTKVSALGVEEQRVKVIVDILSPPALWRNLADGYRVEVTFEVLRADDVLQVPDASLVRTGDRWAVYRVADGVATLQPVEVGQRDGVHARILKGLAAGDQVVAYPDGQVEDGVRVVARASHQPAAVSR
ncbi:efflux RND transporter periplasmic adaptor subunit [Sediminicurvatus halobius]|uniref:Efflux transporter periplasmic adaptor subunit n=1 Tax=Sediminicurvatus halobius TaxID=2182432 RepID=A0A2U2MYW6_9GAMM|nr:efflux RND transporter periplasmic adaptor subunit [Spiribacter halobius]PWG61904.1 efflux transporter periplasmic adaptor subunit [Spiribacter halobius]UEX79221.1 efflux RND transporter periplasmic adaptor subunit [Spiribacter halobius]